MVQMPSPSESPGSRSLFQSLPPELLHHIFSLMRPEDVVSARATCSVFATVGLDYMLNEVKLVFKRDRFRRLLEISKHETLRNCVKSLYFQGDHFQEHVSYPDWDAGREDPYESVKHSLQAELPDPSLTRKDHRHWDPRTTRAVSRAFNKHKLRSRGRHTDAEVYEAYNAYANLMEDQRRVSDERFDVLCLTLLFRFCPHLDTLTLAFGHGPKGDRWHLPFAFKETFTYPKGDVSYQEQGIRQLLALSQALVLAGKTLKNFTACDVSYHLFRQSADAIAKLRVTLQPLHELRLGMQAWSKKVEDEETTVLEAVESFQDGIFHDMIADARELRVLKLGFPSGRQFEARTDLNQVIGSTTWPKLRELGLSRIHTTEDELVDLIFRHKDTLRRLSLSYVDFSDGCARSLLKRIGGKLPKLRKAKLRGVFSASVGATVDFQLHDPRCRCKDVAQLRDAIDAFVLRGGDYQEVANLPRDAVGFSRAEPTDHSQDIELDGYTSDGSVMSYGSDDFDAQI